MTPESYVFTVGDDPGRDYTTLLAAVEDTQIELIMRTSLPLSIDPSKHQQVRAITNRLSFEALRDLYAFAAIVVIPLADTLNASGVSSVLEAAAMGKAIIVSKSGGIEDFVIPGETCLEVPCCDPTALKSAIQQLRNEPETRARLGRNARAFFEKNCSSVSFGKRFAETLRHLALK